jgi:hypothetical protein
LSRRPELDEFVERVRDVPRQDLLDAAAVECLDALEVAGVEALLLKGPALDRRLYQPREHRGYSDIDLLVDPQGLDKARQTLAGLGYDSGEPPGIDDVAGVLHAEAWFRYPDLEVRPLVIDIHWRLAGCDAPADVTWEELAARRGRIELDGRAVATLTDDGLALHLATHAAQDGPVNVKALADLDRGVKRWPLEVWRSAARLANDLDGTQAFAAGLRLTRPGAELARELELPPSDELDWAIHNRETRPRGTFHLHALAEARGAAQRLDVIRRSLFPRREWITWEYRWAEDAGTTGLIAAYALHLLRAPTLAARAWRYRSRERRAGR